MLRVRVELLPGGISQLPFPVLHGTVDAILAREIDSARQVEREEKTDA